MEVSIVIEYDLTLFNEWGQELYNTKGFNPNGFQNFDIIWNGTHNNGSAVQQDVYAYELNLRNCSDVEMLQAEITCISPFSTPLWTPDLVYGETYETPSDCCLEDVYFSQTSDMPLKTESSTFIEACCNAIVLSGQSVTFQAQNEIRLLSGFKVENGGIFSAIIEPCSNTTSSARLVDPSDKDEKPEEFDSVKIYPNPTRSMLHIQSDQNGFVFLFNLLVDRLISKEKTNYSHKIDIENLPSGVYILKFNNEAYRIVKQ